MAAGCLPRLMGRFVGTAADGALSMPPASGSSAPPPPFLGAYGWGP